MENMETTRGDKGYMTFSPTRKKTGKEFIDFFKDVLEKTVSKKMAVKENVEESLTRQEKVCLKRSAKVVLIQRRLIHNSRFLQEVKDLARQELMENNLKTESELAILNIPD